MEPELHACLMSAGTDPHPSLLSLEVGHAALGILISPELSGHSL